MFTTDKTETLEAAHAEANKVNGTLGRVLRGGVMRSYVFEDLSFGKRESVMRTVLAADVSGFATLSWDMNPVHLSDHYAKHTRFGQRIAHGMLTASLVSAVIGTRLPGPEAIYLSQSLHFRAPVRIGDVVSASLEVVELVAERRRVRLACECVADAAVVLDGEAWVQIPARSPRA